MIQILQNLLLHLPFRILCISRAFSLVKIPVTQRPPPAILAATNARPGARWHRWPVPAWSPPCKGSEVTQQRVTPRAAVSVILFGSLFFSQPEKLKPNPSMHTLFWNKLLELVVPGSSVGYKLLSIRMMGLGDSLPPSLAQVGKGWSAVGQALCYLRGEGWSWG